MVKVKQPGPDWGSFERITADDDLRSIIGASQGVPGSGKTHFWFTAPGPIAYFRFDPGGDKGLRSNPIFRDKELWARDYCNDLNMGKLDKDKRIRASLEVLQMFQEDWDIAIKNARTLIIDKEQKLWEVLRYAHDEVDSPTPKNFHDLNMMYQGWIQDAEVNGRNLGLIRDVHDTWGKIGVSEKTGRPQMGFTGIMKPDGQKYVPGYVQINLEHRWDGDERRFKVKILEKCRLGPAATLMGKEIADLDFPTLAMMLFPESDISEWE